MSVRLHYLEFIAQLSKLYEQGESEAIADIVFEHFLGERINAVVLQQKSLGQTQLQVKNDFLLRLLNHEPVQHIVGKAWFYEMPFIVSQAVLIPRPETEELVERVIKFVGDKALRILDVGTGSGCIAIAIKKHCPRLLVSAVDVSIEALDIAKQNASSHSTDVAFILSDFLNQDENLLMRNWDVIVSNPPYIAESEADSIAANVKDFEPGGALFVTDNDPLIFYKAIADYGVTNLTKEGKIFVEINQRLGEETLKVFSQSGYEAKLHKDLQQNDRIIEATPIR